MDGFTTYIDLSEALLVGAGHKRSVYEHRAFPGMLIKVVRPDLMTDDGQLLQGPKKKLIRWPPRLGAFLAISRELNEYLAFAVRRSNRQTDWPIQRFWGFVETDMGLGLIVEKLTAPTGELAPTLETLVQEGRFEPGHRQALIHLFDELARLHICIGNLHRRNIVFVGENGKGGRFIGVDGLGEKNLIPVAEWLPAVNRWQIRRRCRKLLAHIDHRLARRTDAGDDEGQENPPPSRGDPVRTNV